MKKQALELYGGIKMNKTKYFIGVLIIGFILSGCSSETPKSQEINPVENDKEEQDISTNDDEIVYSTEVLFEETTTEEQWEYADLVVIGKPIELIDEYETHTFDGEIDGLAYSDYLFEIEDVIKGELVEKEIPVMRMGTKERPIESTADFDFDQEYLLFLVLGRA